MHNQTHAVNPNNRVELNFNLQSLLCRFGLSYREVVNVDVAGSITSASRTTDLDQASKQNLNNRVELKFDLEGA